MQLVIFETSGNILTQDMADHFNRRCNTDSFHEGQKMDWQMDSQTGELKNLKLTGRDGDYNATTMLDNQGKAIDRHLQNATADYHMDAQGSKISGWEVEPDGKTRHEYKGNTVVDSKNLTSNLDVLREAHKAGQDTNHAPYEREMAGFVNKKFAQDKLYPQNQFLLIL